MKDSRWLALILLLAAVLRLYNLSGESLWLDETFTVQKIGLSYPAFIHHFTQETQTILYYLLEKIWCGMAGTSEFSLRFPSVIFGLLAVYGTFLLARELFSPTAALLSAFFMAINPFCLFYSQDARPYSLFLAGVVFSLYWGLLLLRRPDWKIRAAYVFSTVVALYVHPLAPLLFGVHVAGFFLFRDSTANPSFRFTALLRWMFLCGLLFIPQILLLKHTFFAKTAGVSSASWIPKPNLYSFVETFRQFFMNPGLGLAVVMIFGAAVVLGFSEIRKNLKGLLYLTALIVCMMIGPWVISHAITPVYVPRYVIPALAAFVIGLGWAVSVLPRLIRNISLAGLILLSAVTLYAYYSGVDKDPWRETAEAVRGIGKPGDIVVAHAFFTRYAVFHYFEPPDGVMITQARRAEELPAAVDTAKRVILVLSYDHPDKENRELIARITRDRFVRMNRSMMSGLHQNPWAYWIADIRVIVYERPDAP